MAGTAGVILSVWKLGIAVVRSREDAVGTVVGLCSRGKLEE